MNYPGLGNFFQDLGTRDPIDVPSFELVCVTMCCISFLCVVDVTVENATSHCFSYHSGCPNTCSGPWKL